MCCRYHVSGLITQEIEEEGILPDSLWYVHDADRAPGRSGIHPSDSTHAQDRDIHPVDLTPAQGRDIHPVDLTPAQGRDIHPSDLAPVIIQGRFRGNGPLLSYLPMRWGLSVPGTRQLLINARAETVTEKRMFMDGVRHRRCAIPAEYFYEWDREKQKVEFSLKDHPLLYMAGFYNPDAGPLNQKKASRFIILTTAANGSMAPVHDRMPLILPREAVQDWICNSRATEEWLCKPSPMLQLRREYEQLSFF